MGWFKKYIGTTNENRSAKNVYEFGQKADAIKTISSSNDTPGDQRTEPQKKIDNQEDPKNRPYKCDMCGVTILWGNTKKLLAKRFCVDCISRARSDRRKTLAESQKEEKKEKKKKINRTKLQEKRLSKKEEQLRKKISNLQDISQKLEEYGPAPLRLSSIPFTLKRNEKVYFLAKECSAKKDTIAFALTNYRLFFVNTRYSSFQMYSGDMNNLSITSGIKPVSLSSVIAIDDPANIPESAQSINLHLNNGKGLTFIFEEKLEAALGYTILKEMVDRLNDPIDDAAFSPKRERMSDDLKVAVWRRDGGACVRCGSREKLEYDHIIPVSKGGSSTIRNVELLCESCNRTKSNRIM